MSDFKIDIGIVRGETYLNVHGNTSDDIDKTMAEAFPIYKKFRSAVEAAYEGQKTASSTEAGLKANCSDCGTEMVYKEGYGKKGKWKALFCPKAIKGDNTKHKPVWL